MTLPLDDQQLMRHNASQMVQGAHIIYQELRGWFSDPELINQLLVEWWRISLASSLQPDFTEMLRAITGGDDEE